MLYQLSYARNGADASLAHELVAVSQYLRLRIKRDIKRMGDLGVRYRNFGKLGADDVPGVVIESEAQNDRGSGVQRVVDCHARYAATGTQRL